MHLVVIGLNHEKAPIVVRERFRIPEPGLGDALRHLRALPAVHEHIILSTCNRTEVYACTTVREEDNAIRQWLGAFCGVAVTDFLPYLYAHAGHKAAEHLFRVAAGIDSMVVGEAQILGQVKIAYTTASREACIGPVLNVLFQQAIAVGKRARTETEIGCGAFSVSSVAVQLAKTIFGHLQSRTVLIIGASKMGELTITHLMAAGADQVVVTNRTYARAEELAARFGGRAVDFTQLPTALAGADIVISSAGSTEPIITRALMTAVMRARHGRPLFMIDIAVPRNIEGQVGELDNVFVYNIDDLQSAIHADIASRTAEVACVEAIIAEEVEAFNLRLRTLEAVPVIQALRSRFDHMQQAEMARLDSKLRHLSPTDREAIRLSMQSVINKISHQPLIRIKDYAARKDGARLETICELFDLEIPTRDATEE